MPESWEQTLQKARMNIQTTAKTAPGQVLLREDVGPIAVITLNRPAARNSLSEALLLALTGAVTTNLNINFLRKPAPHDLIAETRLIKLGKRLAVGEVEIYCEGEDEMVAHATATYSIPPREG